MTACPRHSGSLILAESASQDIKLASMVTSAEWVPGSLNFDPLGLFPKNPAARRDRVAAEVRRPTCLLAQRRAVVVLQSLEGARKGLSHASLTPCLLSAVLQRSSTGASQCLQ